MRELQLSDLYVRGLRDFSSLEALERDVFVVHDANLYYEMEGSLIEYVFNGLHTPQLEWLRASLARTGDAKSSEVLAQLMAESTQEVDRLQSLSDQFYSLMEHRWKVLERYLEREGAVLAD